MSPYFQTFEHHTWITIPKVSFTPWNAELFAYGKKYLVQMMSHGYFKEKFFLNQYFYGIPASRQRIIENYQTFSRTDFSTYLKKYFLQ
ncbi:MAG: hypothetical protein LBG59_03105 [Candidatus Peribacteria bacterium]|nr:hypothetical protein [Candidatus Peribacteria bacterium]